MDPRPVKVNVGHDDFGHAPDADVIPLAAFSILALAGVIWFALLA